MEGNRWAFPYMLRGSVYMVFCILTAFGAIGYLRYLNIEKPNEFISLLFKIS